MGGERQYRGGRECRQDGGEIDRGFFAFRQRSEQYRTASQTFAHLRRHANGRPQAMQVFVGKSAFFAGIGSHPAPLAVRGGVG